MGHLSELIEDVLEGYRTLERTEKAIARRTVNEHGELVRLWCKSLAVYLDGMRGIHPVEDADENKRFARIVRMQFFALGMGHVKTALDGALAGNYHHAFFSIRYMAELLMQAAYVRLRSDEARRWYKQHAQPYTADFEPGFEKAFRAVTTAVAHAPDAQQRMVQLVHDIAKEMDTYGAHPSQETLLQTFDQAGEHAKIGARYDRRHCIAALDRGALLTLNLLDELSDEISISGEEWATRVEALWRARRTAMAPYYDEDSPSDATS